MHAFPLQGIASFAANIDRWKCTETPHFHLEARDTHSIFYSDDLVLVPVDSVWDEAELVPVAFDTGSGADA